MIAKRFKPSEELKLLRLFNRIFNDEIEQGYSEDLAVSKGICVTDAANVLLCEALTEQAKRFLVRYKWLTDDDEDKGESLYKKPELEYTISGELAVSSFSMEYMSKIMSIMDLGEKVKITNRKDYPITIENEHFRFILAPRVDD
jgi:hypothetical protein